MAMSDSARDEIRDLRRQVNQLMEDRVSPVLSDAKSRAGEYASRAGDYAKSARAYTEDGADMVADQVRDQPLIAIGVAAAVGFLLGRITK